MPKLEGFVEVAAKLKKMANEAAQAQKLSCVIGYTAAYALFVHECVDEVLRGIPRPAPSKGLFWDPQGKAESKFLEGPAREFEKVIAEIVAKTFQETGKLGKSLYMGGLFLQRQSMKRVPVDTGNLKASAFTRLEPTDAGNA